MAHIKIENLYKSYINRRIARRDDDDRPASAGSEIVVLKDINLEFEDGEMVCILGASGCGKSTMLRMLAGFDSPTSGRILIDGEEVKGPSSNYIYVFQHNGLLPWMTIWQNVELGVRHMQDEVAKNEVIQEHIDMVELTGFEGHYIYQLSGGMRRRAELARALAVEPDMLIMDEPFTGLDFLTRMRMREEVINMHEYIGKTIVLVTHDIDDALVMGDRIVLMAGTPAEVKVSQRILDMPHPRNLEKESTLCELREELYMKLGVSHVA